MRKVAAPHCWYTSMIYQITRHIEIDAGHRVPDHGSKCRNLHGHRWKVEVAISSTVLKAEGPETGMVKDFGFLKQILLDQVHAVCDHKMMLYINDPIVPHLMHKEHHESVKEYYKHNSGFVTITTMELDPIITEFVLCSFVPTAENLAKAWYDSIAQSIGYRPDYVRVWETPNTTATFN